MKINKKLHSLLALVIQAICLIAVIMIMNSCEPIGGQAAPRNARIGGMQTITRSLAIGGQYVPRALLPNVPTAENEGNVSELLP